MRNEPRSIWFNVFHWLPTGIHVTLEVMVRTIRKTSQLIKALAWEIIFKINSPLTIVSQVIGWYVVLLDIGAIKTQVVKPLPKVLAQQFKTLLPFTFFYEVFNFHLFKLTYAEKKFTWCNFVSKGFTD